MKIDTKPLKISKKSVEVTRTWAQQDQADDLMITSLETQSQTDMLKTLKANRAFRKKTMAFFKESLGLSEKEIEQAFAKVPGETMSLYVSYVCGLIEGAPEESFADFEKEVTKTDVPKEPSEKSED